MKQIRIEAISQHYTAIETVAENKSVERLKLIRSAFSETKRRMIMHMAETFWPELLAWEAEARARKEWKLDDKNKLHVKITSHGS